MKLSKYFTLEEMNCKCKKCSSSLPSKTILKNLINLALEMDKLRIKIGKPINVNSAYRCVEHNKAIGGVSNSAHTLGYACDWNTDDMSEEDMFKIASGLDYKYAGKRKPTTNFKGVGYYKNKGFCHVDIMPTKPRPNTWVG